MVTIGLRARGRVGFLAQRGEPIGDPAFVTVARRSVVAAVGDLGGAVLLGHPATGVVVGVRVADTVT